MRQLPSLGQVRHEEDLGLWQNIHVHKGRVLLTGQHWLQRLGSLVVLPPFVNLGVSRVSLHDSKGAD